MSTVKSGSRALGVAASDGSERSYFCGAVVRADRIVDGFVFADCTIGGLDATASLVAAIQRLNRPDVRWVLLSGVAPAWFNVVDVEAVADAIDRPVLSVSFEDSEGLDSAIDREFDGRARADRLARYEALPDRWAIDLGVETRFLRVAGIDRAAAETVVRAFTPEGGRPEPIRIARSAARAHRTAIERA
ncbi:MAG: DUF99 family protein [Halobacteriota archaeon]